MTAAGYYCWVGGEKTWHETLDGAEVKARENIGYYGPVIVQVVCCACGNEVGRGCHCEQTEARLS